MPGRPLQHARQRRLLGRQLRDDGLPDVETVEDDPALAFAARQGTGQQAGDGGEGVAQMARRVRAM